MSQYIISKAYKVPQSAQLQKTICGLTFPHPVGLAAGLDKNAKAYKMFGAMGFSFVEVGTVTLNHNQEILNLDCFAYPKIKQ